MKTVRTRLIDHLKVQWLRLASAEREGDERLERYLDKLAAEIRELERIAENAEAWQSATDRKHGN